MRTILLVLLILAPAAAFGAEFTVSDQARIAIDDSLLVVTRAANPDSAAITIGVDGELLVAGRTVALDAKQRARLVAFFAEARVLGRMADDLGEEVGRITRSSAAYDEGRFGAALRSLADGDAERSATRREADRETVARHLQDALEGMEKSARRMERQSERLAVLAGELRDTIPALAAVTWFPGD